MLTKLPGPVLVQPRESETDAAGRRVNRSDDRFRHINTDQKRGFSLAGEPRTKKTHANRHAET